ncbi:MAG TPA: SGNH/GDSL hydrolase family protein [Rubricoccaceae bacterium]|jgi:lysophospholipase L1-like esterase
MRRLPLLLCLACAGCVRPTPPPSELAQPTVAPPATAANFAAEIARFEADDRASPPAPGGVLFLGSSSFRLWPDFASDFPDVPVLNRAFGGATFPDVLYYAPRIVLPARPRLIVLYVGDNDLGSGRTPEQVAADYASFVAFVRRALPQTQVAYVSIKPSPSRWAIADAMREANARIAEQVARDGYGTYIDVFTPMLRPDGRPDPALYLADSLHMTPAGYAIWRAEIAPVLR